MLRSGSITGVAIEINIESLTVGGTMIAEIRKNDVVVFSASKSVWATAFDNWSATQANGVDTFVAGDVIQMSLKGGAGVIMSIRPIIVCEVSFP